MTSDGRYSRTFLGDPHSFSRLLHVGAARGARWAEVLLVIGVPAVYAGVAALSAWLAEPVLPAKQCTELNCTREVIVYIAFYLGIVVVPILLIVFLILVACVPRESKFLVAIALLVVETVVIGALSAQL